MADPDRYRAGAASTGGAGSRSRQHGEVSADDDAAGAGADAQAPGRRAGDGSARPEDTGDTPAADAGQAGDDWVPL